MNCLTSKSSSPARPRRHSRALSQVEAAGEAARRAADLVFKPLIKEPLIAILRTDHQLAALDAFSAENLVGETFISVADHAPAVRAAIDDYLRCSGFDITPDHEATSTYMAISLVVSTRGIALLPLYTQNFLPPSVTSRPIKGEAPTIDLVLGYHKENNSPLLKLFLSKVDNLIDRVSERAGESRGFLVARDPGGH